MTKDSTRRFFVGAATAAAASRVWGANDRINVGIVGVGGRGGDHLRVYSQLPGARVVGVCDVSQAARERAQAMLLKNTGEKAREFEDMREVYADSKVDAVSIATPNHWHALAAIWAMKVGKDVYAEKPASYDIAEGLKMVEVARDSKRMLQIGSQHRSNPFKIRGMAALRGGLIGDIYHVRGLCFKRRRSIGSKPDTPVPPGVNWDLFRGPAPMRPFNELRFKYNWHWFWDTGNGDIGNQGVHEMDIARWGLGKSELPKSVYSFGGKFIYDDDQETPNTQTAIFDYGDAQMEFEVRGLITPEEGKLAIRGGNTVGNIFFGSEGVLVVDLMGYQVYKGEEQTKVMDVRYKEPRAWDTAPHMANFVEAVKSRKTAELHAEIEIGAGAAALCHMANISYRLGRKLAFDPKLMRFIGDAEANRMITREYRRPYVVPEKV